MNNRNDVLAKIIDVLTDKFSEIGFVHKKNIFEKIILPSKKYQYVIDIKRKFSSNLLHLTLRVLDKSIKGGSNVILKKALMDKEMKFPENWAQKDIEYSINGRTKNDVIAALTDWRVFKNPDETLENFNRRFSIWLPNYFNEIDEIENWKDQLLTSIDFSKKWFEQFNDDENYRENIIKNTLYESLYLLKLDNRVDCLKKKYQECMLEYAKKYKGWDSRDLELKLYYKYLMEE